MSQGSERDPGFRSHDASHLHRGRRPNNGRPYGGRSRWRPRSNHGSQNGSALQRNEAQENFTNNASNQTNETQVPELNLEPAIAQSSFSSNSGNPCDSKPTSSESLLPRDISFRGRSNEFSRFRRNDRRPPINPNENDPVQHRSREEQNNRRGQRRMFGRASNLRFLRETNSLQGNSRASTTQNDNDKQGTATNLSVESPSQDNLSKDASNIQSEIAEQQFKRNDFECMICCDNIHRSNPIWYCDSCYNIFHLKCAIEWCNKSIKSRNEAIANAQYPSLGQVSTSQNNLGLGPSNRSSVEGYSDYRLERTNSVEWPCPTCREVLYSKPGKYKCFCGKVIQPDVNRHLTPHSCGQLCGRNRPNSDCPHACNSVCHPGRCAPCQLTSRKTCFCGKLTKEVKCSSGTVSCGDICNKSLPCQKHFCSKVCHMGSCGSCDEVITISCHCGQQVMQKFCVDVKLVNGKKVTNFSCSRICGKLLDCGKHYCNEKCHPGPNCPSCKLLSQNIKTCPCGSTLIKKALLAQRKSCEDHVPTCENRCNRTLICGTEKSRHKCQKKCHTGPCPPCKMKTQARCECKLSTKTIDCSTMYEKVEADGQVLFRQIEYTFSCETRCNRPKNCGRHRCNNKCCNFGKTFDPSIHRCDQICNRKLPCGVHNCPEICHPGQCGDCTNIGWEELTCHCGASILYPPIPCGARPPACHRPCRRAHNCGHLVKHECHDDTEKCAPCTVFVKKSCFCGADSKDSVYCYLPGYSCGRTCKKQLACTRHRCQRVCHDNECETPDGRGIISCIQPCSTTRYICKHPCGLPCHGISPCPISDCKKTVEVSCECGNKVERTECHKVMRDVDKRNKLAMLSTNRDNQDQIMIDLSKSQPPKATQDNDNSLKKLDCDEACSIFKRNKALAEALDIAQPDLKPTSVFGEDPLRLLKEATVQDYKFVSATFDSLVRFIKSAKESDKRFIFMQFPPTGKLRREVIHELAHHFNCTSESREEEPFRHVVVRAYKNKSIVPNFSIEQLLPVSD